MDEPTTLEFNEQTWTPGNYDGEYDGPITLRRALALSRNIADDQGRRSGRLRPGRRAVAARRRRHAAAAVSVDRARRVRGDAVRDRRPPTRVFPNGGTIRPLRAISRLVSGGQGPADADRQRRETVARPDTTFLVTNMMRSVHQRRHRRRRARGRLRARRRRQVRHDQRSARRLVRRLHAGAADRRLGRPRRQPAARPERHAGGAADLDGVHDARARRPPERPFEAPEGITFVDIDRDTGKLAAPGCPRTFHEAFLAGTEPTEICQLHSAAGRPDDGGRTLSSRSRFSVLGFSVRSTRFPPQLSHFAGVVQFTF